MSASFHWIAWKSAIFWPKASLSLAYLVDSSRARCAIPRAWAAMPIRPPSSVAIAMLNPLWSSPSRFSFGIFMPSKPSETVSLARIPILSSFLRTEKPSASVGMMNAEISCFCRPVRAYPMMTWATESFVAKHFVPFKTNASVAQVIIGYARTGRQKHEISAFIIPTDAEGFSVLKKEDKMGIRASDTVLLGFDGMKIPKENLLGELHKGFNIAMATLDGGRIGIAAQALGIAQRALDESTKYAKEREAFGQKIADFQAIQWKLADMATEIEAARLLTYRAAQMEDLGRRHTYESSVAKLFASEAAHRAVDAAVQIHGGYGFIKDYVVEKLYRDQRVTEIYEGTSEIQRMVIARAVLGK